MGNLTGDASDPAVAAVRGTHTGAGGSGVIGEALDGPGVLGLSKTNGVTGRSTGDGFSGVVGEATTGPGVFGGSKTSVGVDAHSEGGPAALRAVNTGGPGVVGVGKSNGVIGRSSGDGFAGVVGEATTGPGVSGSSRTSVGVDAHSEGGPAALRAVNTGGAGVVGVGTSNGVIGRSSGDGFSGVVGEATTGPGVFGGSKTSVGVDAHCERGPAALRAVHATGGVAGAFGGDVQVTQNVRVDGDIEVKGDIRLANADCAEDFDIADGTAVEPGTVMVLNDAGELAASGHAFDRRVAGVVSGAGTHRPGIVLDRRDTGAVRQPIALLGKVFCKVDAQFGAIAIGDLLTTSPTPGHAMTTNDPVKAFGAVIGKALRPWKEGQGLIPVLIALQ